MTDEPLKLPWSPLTTPQFHISGLISGCFQPPMAPQTPSPAQSPATTTPATDSPYFFPLTSNNPPYSPNFNSPSSGPVITASVMTRNDQTPPIQSSSSLSTSSSSSPHRLSPEAIQQFALHIPPPPTLSLSQSAVRNPPSNANNLAPRVSVSSTPSPMPNTNLDSFPSPMDRTRRMPPSSQTPDMTLSSSTTAHTLSVMLPQSIQPEMVTISANKGDRLRVVADAWHMEGESHYEWQISFPPSDVDIRAVHAKFHQDGRLTIDVKRRCYI